VAEEADLRRELEDARATIAAQDLQIHRLEQAGGDGRNLLVLRELLELSNIVGSTVGESPYRALLSGLIEAAKRLFDAAAASVLMLDHATTELVFEASSDREVLGMRFPAHQGIAGWVMMTGEPIAVGDVRRDPRFAKDFAASTGYVPKSILAVPMIVGDEVEGVMEVLDKKSAASFGLDDMELMGMFARPAAIAVEQARMVTSIGELLIAELGRLAEGQGDRDLAEVTRAVLDEESAASDQTLELARMVHRIAKQGDRSRELALEILSAIARFTA